MNDRLFFQLMQPLNLAVDKVIISALIFIFCPSTNNSDVIHKYSFTVSQTIFPQTAHDVAHFKVGQNFERLFFQRLSSSKKRQLGCSLEPLAHQIAILIHVCQSSEQIFK